MTLAPPPPPLPLPPFAMGSRRTAARGVCAVFAILTGAVLAAIAFFTLGEVEAILTGAGIFFLGIWGALGAPRSAARALALALVLAFVGGSWFIADQAIAIVRALSTTEGPVDPPDPIALAAAELKIEEAGDESAFRITMTEAEITSVIQEALAQSDEAGPVRSILVDIKDGEDGDPGRIDIEGQFKSGDMSFAGSISAELINGAVQVEVLGLEVGALDLPGVGKDALEDLLAEVADINEVLLRLRADVQSIEVGNDQITVTGTHPDGPLTSDEFLTALSEQAGSLGSGPPPPERIGPGVVDGTTAEGPSYYVALGDSLAANVGVDSARLGYVSRLHSWLQERDGATYGLRNFGISGETSGTMIRSGQLDEALSFMAAADVRYVTIDIGGNDLLGHLGSGDCSADVDSAACQSRLDATFATYEENMVVILDALENAAPGATVVFLRSYNPFSLGLADVVEFERRSDEVLDAFNDIAAALASERGIRIADGFTPMQGTTGVTTHMLDASPDIHPLAIGFDVLAAALAEAI